MSLLCLASFAAGCGATVLGPPYSAAPQPPEHRARIYVYRTDDRSSLASVRVTIDGLEVGRFRDREYETLELPAGTHHLRAGLRGFGWLAWGWNDQRIRMGPGETVYVMLSVRLSARSAPAAPGLEIGGRTDGAASENVFIIPRSAEEATSELVATTRLVPAKSVPN